mmetsp:Transcript_28964/g.44513  ORF Transcript_28964/g.44513 Transcript_28964/m.44513 type:complete len:245 (+) Transcript_28964:140-874(+)
MQLLQKTKYKALVRMERVQEFRATYHIEDEAGPNRDKILQDGLKRTKACIDMNPGMVWGLQKDTSSGRVVWTGDCKMLNAKKIKTEEDWNNMMGGLYYMFQSMQCDLESIRNGVAWIGHCQEVSWARNFHYEYQKQAAALYSHGYPIRIKEITFLDSPFVFTVVYNIIKIFISKKVRGVVNLVKTSAYFATDDDKNKTGIIRNKYSKESLPVSMGGTLKEEDLMESVERLLKQRLENSASFKLP